MPITPFNIRVGKAGRGSGVSGSSDETKRQFESIVSDFMAFCSHVEGQTPEVLLAALEPTYKKSQGYCPVDTGALLNSGYLEIVGRARGGGGVVMGYGRGGLPSYAAVVHEDTTMSHEAPTRAKWLQGAVEEDYFTLLDRVASGARYAAGMGAK